MRPRDKETTLTRNFVLKLLSYNPETGEFKWTKGTKKQPPGTVDKLGYRRISIKYRLYYAHRLAWLLVHNEWPIDRIDHINGDPSDNRILNLRQATSAENKRNSKTRTDNLLKVKGVQKRNNGKYRARIYHNNKHISLGMYNTKEEAHAAYIAKAKELHEDFMRAS
jgi:hypothetical protein